MLLYVVKRFLRNEEDAGLVLVGKVGRQVVGLYQNAEAGGPRDFTCQPAERRQALRDRRVAVRRSFRRPESSADRPPAPGESCRRSIPVPGRAARRWIYCRRRKRQCSGPPEAGGRVRRYDAEKRRSTPQHPTIPG